MKRESGRSAGTVFADDGWLVFELVPPPSGGSRTLLDVSMAQQVARAMRGTLLAAIDGGWPEVLSGHAPDGRPSDRPHLAVLPLADLGHPYATGTILGVALVPPVDLDEASRRALMTAVAKAEQRVQADDVDRRDDEPPALRLTLGRAGTMDLRRARDVSMKKTLRLETWTRPSARWATVTAVALGRNPGNLRSREPEVIERAVAAAEATIAASCLHIGLPQPAAVWVHKRSLLEGAPEARRFTPFPSAGDGPRRVCVHAEIVFDEPVRGPVLLGAGRYLGLGICRPLGDG